MPALVHNPRLRAVLFVTLFLLAAALFSYLLVRRDTDYVTLTVNHEWRIYLVGEHNVYAVEYRAEEFTRDKIDSRHIWLQGHGDIRWHNNTIQVHESDITLNTTRISKSGHDTLANILFAQDGTIRKELLEVRPGD